MAARWGDEAAKSNCSNSNKNGVAMMTTTIMMPTTREQPFAMPRQQMPPTPCIASGVAVLPLREGELMQRATNNEKGVSFPPPTAQKLSTFVCASLCWFMPVCAVLCHSPVFLQADRFLAPFFRRLKKIVNKKGATGFKAPPFPPKKTVYGFFPVVLPLQTVWVGAGFQEEVPTKST